MLWGDDKKKAAKAPTNAWVRICHTAAHYLQSEDCCASEESARQLILRERRGGGRAGHVMLTSLSGHALCDALSEQGSEMSCRLRPLPGARVLCHDGAGQACRDCMAAATV